MGNSINPLLLDKASATPPARNFARPPQSAEGPAFPQQLAAAEKAAAPEAPETDGTASIKPASSWRVNRSAAEVSTSDDDFSLEDFWDIINPLQHIPILSSVYREMTGDEIKPVARVAGDVLFGAVTGSLLISGIASVVASAYEQQTGEDPTIQVADALFGFKKSDPDSVTMLAEADIPADSADSSDETETTKLASAEPAPAPAPAPVQAASVDKEAVNTAVKQPFGGVMAPASPAHVPGMRVGNTIYANPTVNNAARVASIKAAKASAQAASGTAEAPPSQPAFQAETHISKPATSLASMTAPPAMSVPRSEPSGEKTLGQTMHQSAEDNSAGRDLPPELVRDMMIMALDKYKTASGLTAGEITVGAPN